MKVIQAVSTTALFLLFAATVPAFAQDDHHQEDAKPEAKAQDAKPAQHEEQAKPAERQQEAKPEKQAKEAKPAQHQEQPKAAQEEKQAKHEQQQQQARSAKQGQEEQAKSQQKEANAARQQQAKSEGQRNEQAKGHQEQANANHEQGQQHVQRTADEERRQREQPSLRLSARSEARIPDDRFRSNFGRAHEFRIGSPRIVDGYSRFQYGGYWFGFAQAWPEGWYYTDDVYVDYIDGGYYLCNPYYPGARVSIVVVL